MRYRHLACISRYVSHLNMFYGRLLYRSIRRTIACIHSCDHKGTSVTPVSSGQSTLEYLLVLSGFIALIVAVSALKQFFIEGEFASIVFNSLTHSVPQGVHDVVLY